MLGKSFGPVDWAAVFLPDAPLLEIFVRGTVVYLALFTLLRVVLKRQSSGVGVTDVLVIVLIADAAQNAMAGDYKSVPDGVLLVATIIFWSYALDWLSFRSAWVERLITPPPLELVRNGIMLRDNMRQELITVGDLMAQLREQGIDELGRIKCARMEGDGRLSVIRRDSTSPPPPSHHLPGA